MAQTEIDFPLHTRENNSESEQRLFSNRKHFSNKCKELLIRLCNGERLTVYDALVNCGISSLPRRILDLKQNGVAITDEWIKGVKVWFITDEQKIFNKKFLNQYKISDVYGKAPKVSS